MQLFKSRCLTENKNLLSIKINEIYLSVIFEGVFSFDDKSRILI